MFDDAPAERRITLELERTPLQFVHEPGKARSGRKPKTPRDESWPLLWGVTTRRLVCLLGRIGVTHHHAPGLWQDLAQVGRVGTEREVAETHLHVADFILTTCRAAMQDPRYDRAHTVVADLLELAAAISRKTIRHFHETNRKETPAP